MLPVYLCEDNPEIRGSLEEYLKKQILIKGYDMEIVLSAGQPEDILQALGDTPQRGIYFLDVELKGESMDGFQLGMEIRKRDSRGFLIYVTAFKDLAFETFRYHLEALDYIVKDDPERMRREIMRSLDTVTERMEKEQGEQREFFTVRVLDVVKHIPMDDIMFFETTGRSHRLELHGRNDRIDFIGNMQELEGQLGERFLRAHRAYLVNVGQIEALDLKRREILMKNGEKCLFSRGVKNRLLDRI